MTYRRFLAAADVLLYFPLGRCYRSMSTEKRGGREMSRMNRVCLSLVVLLSLTVTAVSILEAGIPRKISFQGRLVDSATGEPEVGSHNMTFRIYDDPDSGTLLWSESQAVESDSAGVFSVFLGSVTPIDLSFDGPVWIEMEVGGGTLAPRRELVSVPFAFRAEEVGHAASTDSLGDYASGDFVRKGEASVVTSGMIVGGAGSSLDADMVDGLHAEAFADSGHVHDGRYYTQDDLRTPGTVNNGGNPVDWTRLKGVPAGFADGTDDAGGVGDGHSLDASDGDPADAVFVDGEGQVGVGTLSPERQLHILGNNPRVLIDAATSNPEVNFRNSGDAYAEMWSMYKDDGTDDLRLFQAGDKVTIESVTGNVGVGTMDPVSKLDVNGSVNATTDYKIAGTTVLGTPGTGNTNVGVGAGVTTTGTGNTFVGNNAGRENSTGQGNVCSGYRAGESNDTGTSNTFVGCLAGINNETGSFNTFLGANVGTSTLNGIGNTLIGFQAGTTSTLGNGNTMVGADAGREATGAYNTFVGNLAGGSNHGSNNVFLGNQAGYNDTEGSEKLYIANGPDTSDVLIYGDFASGRVGLGGVVNPTAALTINANVNNVWPPEPAIVLGGDNPTILMGQDASARCSMYFVDGRLGFTSTGQIRFETRTPPVQYVVIAENGDVGVGTLTPERKLHIMGDNPRIMIEAETSNPEINFKSDGDAASEIWALYKNSSNDDLYFLQNGSVSLALKNSTGNVGIGTNSTGSYKLYVQGEAYSTVNWSSSDRKFKQEIEEINGALDKVLRMRGVRFRWRTEEYGDRGFPEGRHYGVVAQEAEKVMPEIVREGPEGERTVAYSEIIPVLIESVKELKAENDLLRKRIEALERKVD
jgi:hypothetical protein